MATSNVKNIGETPRFVGLTASAGLCSVYFSCFFPLFFLFFSSSFIVGEHISLATIPLFKIILSIWHEGHCGIMHLSINCTFLGLNRRHAQLLHMDIHANGK